MEKIKPKTTLDLCLLIVLFSMILLLLTGCTKDEKDLIENKIKEELSYMENNIYSIASKFAKNEYEENILNDDMIQNITNDTGQDIQIKVINFDKVKDDISKINTSLDVTMIDLSEKITDTNTILELSNNINFLTINVGSKDINQVLRDINTLEKSIIKNYNLIFENNNEKKMKSLKADVLDCFILSIIEEDKNLSKDRINSIIENYSNEIKNQEFIENNSYLINNIYILLEEFKTAIDLENEDLIKLKYISLIEML